MFTGLVVAADVREVVPASPLRLVSDHGPLFTATVFGTAGIVVPPYLTEFFVRLPQGAQPLLLLPIALMPVVAAIVWLRVQRSGVEVGADGLHEQRVLLRDRFTPREQFGSAVVLRLIEQRTLRAPRQLFLKDARGRTIFRMREAAWGEQQVEALRARVNVPTQSVVEPLTVAEVRQQHLVTLPWWERLPLARGLALAVVILAGASALLLPLFGR